MVSIIGPSGSGKTTVLRVLMTLEKINGGVIYLDGEPLTHIDSNGKLIEARKEFGKALVRKAREVKQKYISPPETTPFAVVYLPSEGAFIEAIKLKDANDDLVVPSLRKLYHVTIVGPSTFTAFLDSLLVGFETLQITKDASRIYDDLEKLTTKFQNHFNQIEDVQNKIAKASEATSKFSTSATTIKSILESIKKPKD